uniref:Uncharacterized protein n=1 Tax=Oryza rufipogon TaxID=4529 RepID=A0A0E0NN49_ORYRU
MVCGYLDGATLILGSNSSQHLSTFLSCRDMFSRVTLFFPFHLVGCGEDVHGGAAIAGCGAGAVDAGEERSVGAGEEGEKRPAAAVAEVREGGSCSPSRI